MAKIKHAKISLCANFHIYGSFQVTVSFSRKLTNECERLAWHAKLHASTANERVRDMWVIVKHTLVLNCECEYSLSNSRILELKLASTRTRSGKHKWVCVTNGGVSKWQTQMGVTLWQSLPVLFRMTFLHRREGFQYYNIENNIKIPTCGIVNFEQY